ncbi:hypothetical protein SCHPADRAFT_910260 [Schizopora paradoxa]|uniref:Uncharacterized protein n=1 Tax=Schizopora paradoxa TaxID=27342 RepID=A0A0H2R466_9AGAM|nr:hypothetical protein SCHPADRAFT_910260 [Schizopora paradoxa]
MSKVITETRPSRSRGSILTRLKAISSFIDAGAKRDVESVVKKIEQIRRHSETTIFSRHAETSISLSDAELAKLKSLCKKLVDLSSSGRATERNASEELIRLSIEDPRVHLFLRERQLFPSDSYDRYTNTCCSYARFTIDDASVAVHGLWSDLFQMSRESVYGSAQINNDMMAKYLQDNNFYFSDYLKNHELSFLSARYLRHALKLRVVGNALYLIVNLWRTYMKISITDVERSGDESIVEWSTLDGCFQDLPSGVLRTAFAPPPLLADLLSQIIINERAHDLPSAFHKFFRVPSLTFTLHGSRLSQYTFTGISTDESHFHLLPVYHAALFGALGKSHHASALQTGVRVEPKLRIALKKTILDVEKGSLWRVLWKGYCESAWKIWDYYYRNQSLEIKPTQLDAYFLSLVQASNDERNAFATFLAASLLSTWPESNIQMPSNVIDNVKAITGPLTLPLFDNVPYLRRYRIIDTGKILITSDNLPEPSTSLVKNFAENTLHEFTVDTLPLSSSDSLWLYVDGRNASFDANKPPFKSHHYMLFLADDPKEKGKENKPSYIAAVKVASTYHFTHAASGSSSVKYTNDVGTECESQEFLVLMERRYQDVHGDDLALNVVERWFSFWPVKDPLYSALTESANIDDEHLEALLKSFRREGHA